MSARPLERRAFTLARMAVLIVVVLIMWLASALAEPPKLAEPGDPFEFVVIGNLPYDEDLTTFSQLIDAINEQKPTPAFTIHLGDFGTDRTCRDANYAGEMLKIFNEQFENPLIYTPGDNDWSDCGFEPIHDIARNRLAQIRREFFATSKSFGKKKIDLDRQPDPTGGAYGLTNENVQFPIGRVRFVTVHVPSEDGMNQYEALQHDLTRELGNVVWREFLIRRERNDAWIAEAFRRATAENAAALVIAMQAYTQMPVYNPDAFPLDENGYRDLVVCDRENSGVPRYEKGPFYPDKYIRRAIRSGAADSGFKGWILVVQGDTHCLAFNENFLDENDHSIPRAKVLFAMGHPKMHAVRVLVDTSSDSFPFSFVPLFVKGNPFK